MFDRFLEHISSKNYFPEGQKIVLAVSGGLDSMVLLHLMHEAELTFEVAHFDHLTRNGVSTQEAEFVNGICNLLGHKFHSGTIDLSKMGSNFQASAREQRYQFLRSLNADIIVTAHHQDDNIESILINIFQGKSYNSIPEHQIDIVRPLLKFSKAEIYAYAEANTIQYMEDSSNSEDAYLRNFIRINIISQLRQKIENFNNRLLSYSEQMNADQEDLASTAVQILGISDNSADVLIPKSKILKAESFISNLTYHALKKWGFNKTQISNLIERLDNTGKAFHSNTGYRLLIDRDHILIKKMSVTDKPKPFIIQVDKLPQNINYSNHSFEISIEDRFVKTQSADTFQYPLDNYSSNFVFRLWESGDCFKPFGMNGQSQTVKKLFTDNKLNLFEKKTRPILCQADGQILWIAGLRSSELCRIDEDYRGKVLKITKTS